MSEPGKRVDEGVAGDRAGDSHRVAQARARAAQRLSRQRGMLRPLGVVAVVAVIVGVLNTHPEPAFHGEGLAIAAALVVYAVTVALAVRERFVALADRTQLAVIIAMGASGIAIAALQPRGATDLAAGAAVWLAVARLPVRLGAAVAVVITAALGVASGLAGSSAQGVLAAVLLCALLGLIAYFVKQAREDQSRSEVLLAELQDAREEQTRAAALTERGRIAGELHDVLAHALSGAAIQLEGAGMLADREGAGERLRAAIERAGELVRAGLVDAREAVAALRGERLPGVEQLGSLVESFRRDTGMEVTLTVQGERYTLPEEAELALYRGAQEALTNVSRYAPGASTAVTLIYGAGRARLIVEDRVRVSAPAGAGTAGGLASVGGGRGLEGMRERVERAGGGMSAGPTDHGWRVELDLPT